jgi:hypothetical protein
MPHKHDCSMCDAAKMPGMMMHMMKMPNPDEMFKMFDTNHDGVLSKEEFTAGVKKVHEKIQEHLRAHLGMTGKLPCGRAAGGLSAHMPAEHGPMATPMHHGPG